MLDVDPNANNVNDTVVQESMTCDYLKPFSIWNALYGSSYLFWVTLFLLGWFLVSFGSCWSIRNKLVMQLHGKLTPSIYIQLSQAQYAVLASMIRTIYYIMVLVVYYQTESDGEGEEEKYNFACVELCYLDPANTASLWKMFFMYLQSVFYPVLLLIANVRRYRLDLMIQATAVHARTQHRDTHIQGANRSIMFVSALASTLLLLETIFLVFGLARHSTGAIHLLNLLGQVCQYVSSFGLLFIGVQLLIPAQQDLPFPLQDPVSYKRRKQQFALKAAKTKLKTNNKGSANNKSNSQNVANEHVFPSNPSSGIDDAMEYESCRIADMPMDNCSELTASLYVLDGDQKTESHSQIRYHFIRELLHRYNKPDHAEADNNKVILVSIQEHPSVAYVLVVTAVFGLVTAILPVLRSAPAAYILYSISSRALEIAAVGKEFYKIHNIYHVYTPVF